ncbi:MAG: hypothetical protein ACUVT0_11630 [Thermochromatium sp.]
MTHSIPDFSSLDPYVCATTLHRDRSGHVAEQVSLVRVHPGR